MSRLCSLLCLSLTLTVAAAQAEVVIIRTEPEIERRVFDPKDPPSEMPKLHPNEAAVAQSFFGADSRVGGAVIERKKVGDDHHTSIKIDTVRMTLKLRVTIWLPTNAVPKIVKHEEGHREIAEHYYRDAEAIARAEAEKLIGQVVTGGGSDYESAGDAALKQAAVELGQRYLGRTDIPAGIAQLHYDRITQHGTNPIKEPQAIAQAIAKAAEEAGDDKVRR